MYVCMYVHTNMYHGSRVALLCTDVTKKGYPVQNLSPDNIHMYLIISTMNKLYLSSSIIHNVYWLVRTILTRIGGHKFIQD